MQSITTSQKVVVLGAFFAASLVACGTDGDPRDEEMLDGASGDSERVEDGLIVAEFDTIGDGEPDILRYYQEHPHPREENRMQRRIVKMEIDTTGDGHFEVLRFYDEFGNVEREKNDQNLDGFLDTVLYFSGGELNRKERLANPEDAEPFVEERRLYFEETLIRVEKDLNGNGEVDRWEYYEDGVLVRIGLDNTGDGTADTWQFR